MMETGTTKKRILLISPEFFNYAELLIRAFEEKGFVVDWFSDRNGKSFFTKALLRFKKDIEKNSIKKYLNKILAFTKDKLYEYVVVVNGEVLTEDFMLSLKEQHQESKYILYMWDALQNFKDTLKIADHFDKRYTFDSRDVKNYKNFKFLPLFYTQKDSKEKFENTEKKYDYVFIATIKKGKYRYVKEIFGKLDERYNNSYKYLYLQSRLVYFYYKIKYKEEFKGAKMSEFKYKRMDGKTCKELELQAKMIVDIPMKHQYGLTVRTFETLARGQRLLSANKNIVDYDFYDEESIYVYDSEKGFDFEHPFFKEEKSKYNPKIEKYYIQEWVSNLLS